MVIHTDITDRRLAETHGQEWAQQLKLFVEHAPAAVALMDTQMRYISVSQRWLEDYRLQDQAVLGKSHYEVFPEIPKRWKEIHRHCLGGAREACDEDPFLRADGRTTGAGGKLGPGSAVTAPSAGSFSPDYRAGSAKTRKL